MPGIAAWFDRISCGGHGRSSNLEVVVTSTCVITCTEAVFNV